MCNGETWSDRFYRWLAWKLPRCLVKWAFYRVVANATQGEHSGQVVPDLTAMDAGQRWGH